jgi:integrase
VPFGASVEWQVRDPRGRRKYLNAAERQRFLAAADDEADSDRVLCRLMAFTGCRVSEALAGTREDVDAESLAVTFRTLKRRKLVFRSVPIPADLLAQLQSVPIDAAGRLWPLHRTTTWRIIKRVMDRAEIVGPMATCKGLRHGFGMHAIARGVPQHLVQRWLGHASPATTAIYLDAVGIEERQFAERMW